jgi:hypothetical protein
VHQQCCVEFRSRWGSSAHSKRFFRRDARWSRADSGSCVVSARPRASESAVVCHRRRRYSISVKDYRGRVALGEQSELPLPAFCRRFCDANTADATCTCCPMPLCVCEQLCGGRGGFVVVVVVRALTSRWPHQLLCMLPSCADVVCVCGGGGGGTFKSTRVHAFTHARIEQRRWRFRGCARVFSSCLSYRCRVAFLLGRWQPPDALPLPAPSLPPPLQQRCKRARRSGHCRARVGRTAATVFSTRCQLRPRGVALPVARSAWLLQLHRPHATRLLCTRQKPPHSALRLRWEHLVTAMVLPSLEAALRFQTQTPRFDEQLLPWGPHGRAAPTRAALSSLPEAAPLPHQTPTRRRFEPRGRAAQARDTLPRHW